MSPPTSFIAQGLHGFEAGGAQRGKQAGKRADYQRGDANRQEIAEREKRGDAGKIIDVARKQIDADNVGEEMIDRVDVVDREQTEPDADGHAKDADDETLQHENAQDFSRSRPERFHDANLAGLLDGDRNQRAHNAEGRHDDDERQDKEHHRFLDLDRTEQPLVQFRPGLRAQGPREFLVQYVRYGTGAVNRVVRANLDPVDSVAQTVKFLRGFEGHKDQAHIVFIHS